jgi:subtilase family serine protease
LFCKAVGLKGNSIVQRLDNGQSEKIPGTQFQELLPLRKPGLLSPVLVAASLILVGGLSARAASRPLIVDRIDDARLVTLTGNTRAVARNPENDRGPVDENLQLDHMLLLLERPAEKEAELKVLVDAMHTPGSPEFHHWLTPQEFGSRFGLDASDIRTVADWLESHGFVVNRVYPNGTWIDFSGDASQVREAFHTEIHNLEVNGTNHIANVTDPQIPLALAPAIRGIVSLNDFRPHTLHKNLTRAHIDTGSGGLITSERYENLEEGETASGKVDANYTFKSKTNTYQSVVPGDLATIYNLNPLFSAGYSGQGQTIVVIEDTNVYSTADWSTFRSAFGLAKYTKGSFTQVHPGNCSNPGVNAADGEAILDAEYASASAPSAAIQLASCADSRTTFGGLIALQNLINASKTPPAIVSISYGECEAENGATANASFSATYQQAVAEGMSVFVSSGDEGADGCDTDAKSASHGISVNGYASTAYNVAVGGTDFGDSNAGTNASYWNSTNSSTYASAKSYINEIPWNDSCASALLAKTLTGSGAAYGTSGLCNTSTGEEYYLSNSAGSGGPSSCYSGAASTAGVTSGSCKGNAKPSWQTGVVGLPSDGVRDLPDVSLFAANGIWGHYYVYCYSDKANGGAACSGTPSTWSGGGGTSFAAPIMAGIQALVNQKTGARQGNPNPTYYKLAATEYGSTGSAVCNSSKGAASSSTCTFHDVTQGDIDVNCTGTHNCYRPSGTSGVLSTSGTAYKPAFAATTGFDYATGIGSVNALNLVNNWSSAQQAKPKTAGIVTFR